MNLFLSYILFNILNVIIQTARSICTIKGNKYIAAIANAAAYGLYTYIIILTSCELPLWVKILTVACANLVGVFIVKLIEEKRRNNRVWKVEITIPSAQAEQMIKDCRYYGFSHNYIDIDKWFIFNFYCANQKEAKNVKKLLGSYDAKYFVTETKIL